MTHARARDDEQIHSPAQDGSASPLLRGACADVNLIVAICAAHGRVPNEVLFSLD